MTRKILDIVREIKPQLEIESNTILNEGILDSLDIVRLIAEVEKEYGVIFESEDINKENFKTVESLHICALGLMRRKNHD